MSLRTHDLAAVCRVIPEEKLSLRELVAGIGGSGYCLAGVGMVTGVIDFGGKSHWGGSEILHLFKVKIEVFGFHCQFRHIFGSASRMA